MKLNIKIIRLFLNMSYRLAFAILLVCFFATVFCKQNIAAPELLFMVLSFVISYVIREVTYYNIIVFLTHLLMGGAAFFMPFALSEKVLLLLVCIYLYGSSISYAKTGGMLKKTDDLPGPAILLGFLVYFYGWYMKDASMKETAYVMQVVVIFLYLANMYVDGITKYIESSRELKGLPLRNIISVNTVIVLIIAFIMLTALFVADMPDFTGLVNLLVAGFKALLRAVVAFFVLLFRWISLLFSNGRGDDGTGGLQYAAEQDESLLSQIIDAMVTISLAVIIIFLIIKSGKMIISFVRYILSKRNYSGDIVEVIEIEKKKKKYKSQGIFGRISERFSNGERARRIYRNKILNYEPYISLGEDMTARDIEREISAATGENLGELTDAYEKIRYSGERVTAADVKSINILAKRIREDGGE